MKRIKRQMWWGSASFTLLIALFYLENFGGERFGVTALLTYLPQHIFGILPLVLLISAWKNRQMRAVIVNFLALVFWAKFLLGFNLAFPIHHPQAVRVLTFNVELGTGGVPGIAKTIRQQNPDIVCLQESQRAGAPLRWQPKTPGAALQPLFSGWTFVRAGDVATFSRFPLLSQRILPLRGTRRIVETTWQTPHGPLRVLNVHIATSFAGQPYARPGLLPRALQIVANARPTAAARLEQIPALENAIESGDKRTALIMAGDFNSPLRGLFYRALKTKMDDGWTQSGMGVGASFPSRLPLLRIDYLWLRGARANFAQVEKSRTSDHCPLLTEVSWNFKP